MRGEAVLFALLAGTAPVVKGSSSKDQARPSRGDLGTFENPSARVRPRFRYWPPDASVNLTTLAQDIADAGRVGAGGVELLGYYNYGLALQWAGTDWTEYGWGTPAWKALQDTALQATKDNNLIIDLSLGPNEGAGVPAEYDADGLQWDLRPFNVTIPIGGHFDNTLPGWGAGPLVSASSGLVVRTRNDTTPVTYTLSTESLQDLTSDVSSQGTLDVSFPSNATGQHYVIFAYYLVHTGYMEQRSPEILTSGEGVTQSPVTSFVQNGSWVVDHFSFEGARQVAKFWQGHLLGNGSAKLIREVGNYVWEDSQEFPSNIFWTPNVPAAFLGMHGYSVGKYLPILMHSNGGGLNIQPPPSLFELDEGEAGAQRIADFRETMTTLNRDYLDGLTAFAQSLGVQSSAQVVYGFQLDMLANIPHVNAPETETLSFNDNIDAYRYFVGPAGLAGKRVVSSEAGAVRDRAFQQTVPELLWDLKRSIVGGVNAFVLHGMSFSGNYPNTTWPGFVTFFYLFSETNNRHQPGWDYFRDFMDYTGRVQQAMQTGTAKVDLVFWLKNNTYVSVPTKYWPTDLEKAGYTYEYLSPDNFDLPLAQVRDGILAPDAQAFKALILRGNETLTPLGVAKLSQWALQGLPVIFSGGIPTRFAGYVSAEERTSINATLERLTELPNVHMVPFENLALSIASIGIRPRISSASGEPIWYTRWRETEDETIVFVYYDATSPSAPGNVNKPVTFEVVGTPYQWDAWTGEKTALRGYSQTNDSTTIPISLAANQTTIIAFKRSQTFCSELQTPETQNASVAFPLSNWTLTVESWTAPEDLFDVEAVVKTNSTYQITSLLPWKDLDVGKNLTYVAGRGYYNTTFNWPTTSNGSHAFITMSPIFHTAVLYVNSCKTRPLDVTAPRADISRYLKDGVNTVEIVVSTPLANALVPIRDRLRSAGVSPLMLFPGVNLFGEPQGYGLVGEVVLNVY